MSDVVAADPPPEAAYVSLYRRFRPGRFSELRGQDHVVRALRSAVRDGHVAHAYLFSGPRGTGKTSTARILARALNCADPRDGEPCGVCVSCVEIARGTSLDVHELDAASNNGVDAMRDLVSHAALGTPGRWKVYIVDEVHMLSNAAANALLKTLEEPPTHVVFVLATTDPQKVPPTLRSRTQHFEFRLLGADVLHGLLSDVRDQAALPLDDDALSAAVRRGRGSARDALSVLDQVAASGSAAEARPELDEVLEAIAEVDVGRALVAVAALSESGWGAPQLATELVDELRQAFLLALAPELADAEGAELERLTEHGDRLGLPRLVRAIEMLGRAMVDMRDAPDSRVVLEVCLARLARPDLDDSAAALADRVARLERATAPPAAGLPPGAGAAPRGAPPAPAAPAAAPTSAAPAAAPTSAAPAAAPTSADPAPRAPSVSPAPPVASGGNRPSLGALRRQRQAPAPDAAAPTPATPDEPPAAAGAPKARNEGRPGAPAGPRGDPGPAPAKGQAPGPVPDRDTLVEAWGDHILRGLPLGAKALFSAGRFISVDDGVASFALPNQAHCDRCEAQKAVVERALQEHLGVAVRLRLVLDSADGPRAAVRPRRRRRRAVLLLLRRRRGGGGGRPRRSRRRRTHRVGRPSPAPPGLPRGPGSPRVGVHRLPCGH